MISTGATCSIATVRHSNPPASCYQGLRLRPHEDQSLKVIIPVWLMADCLLVSAGAFSNIVLDVSKEAGAYGVGVPYAQDRLRLIHELNPHKRLVTAHGPGVFPPPG